MPLVLGQGSLHRRTGAHSARLCLTAAVVYCTWLQQSTWAKCCRAWQQQLALHLTTESWVAGAHPGAQAAGHCASGWAAGSRGHLLRHSIPQVAAAVMQECKTASCNGFYNDAATKTTMAAAAAAHVGCLECKCNHRFPLPFLQKQEPRGAPAVPFVVCAGQQDDPSVPDRGDTAQSKHTWVAALADLHDEGLIM